MRSYDIFSSEFSPALLDKKKKVICCSATFGHVRRFIPVRIISVALVSISQNHIQAWLKKKKFYCQSTQKYT